MCKVSKSTKKYKKIKKDENTSSRSVVGRYVPSFMVKIYVVGGYSKRLYCQR